MTSKIQTQQTPGVQAAGQPTTKRTNTPRQQQPYELDPREEQSFSSDRQGRHAEHASPRDEELEEPRDTELRDEQQTDDDADESQDDRERPDNRDRKDAPADHRSRPAQRNTPASTPSQASKPRSDGCCGGESDCR